jgi:RNA polymerase sigma factor (sigma-70 family)
MKTMYDDADDWELLERFRLSRDQRAFAELVRRHAGFVLATCRRRLRDAHAAEDATQAVFLVLSRRTPVKSSGNASLAGWLYKTAVYSCNTSMRSTRSRDLHERRAASEAPASIGPSATSIDRADAEMLLDRALAELSNKERDAVLLRFYQDQSAQQVGAALGISANGATKRIGRAIERMREFLAGKGYLIASPAVIESFVQSMPAPDAHPDFVAKVIAVATGQSTASGVVQQLAEGVNHMFRIAQVKLVAAVVGIVVTAGGGVIAVNQLMAQSNAPKSTAAAPDKRAGAATPKAALHALAAAGRAADVEQMKMLVDIKNPSEEQLLLAACEYAAARKTLLEAVNAKFGEPAMTRLGGRMLQISLFDAFLNDLETKTDQRTEKTHGNEAILTATDGEFTDVRLVRDDAGWKLSATGMTKDWPQEKYTEVLTGAQQGTATLSDLTNGIKEGRFATFADLAKMVRGMNRGR